MTAPLSKQEIRRVIRERRHALTAEWCAEQSARIQERVMALPAFAEAAMVAVYKAVPGEVDTSALVGILLSSGRGVSLPALNVEQGGYAMAAISPATRYIDAPYGLREPADPVWVDPALLDCVVVPGVAFDAAGRRVGHGGGYYDRMLAGLKALKIGVAFDFQLFDRVPAEVHDITMDMVITESQVWWPEGAYREERECDECVYKCHSSSGRSWDRIPDQAYAGNFEGGCGGEAGAAVDGRSPA